MSTAGSSSSNTWVINVDKCVGESGPSVGESGPSDPSSERWKYEPSIYKIPDHIVSVNSQLYEPQLVSLGPLNQFELENQRPTPVGITKQRAVHRFTSKQLVAGHGNSDIPTRLYPYLLYPYEHPESRTWSYEYRAHMMFKDGCFILEVLTLGTSYLIDGDNFDKLFSRHGKKYELPIIKRDMLLLENQVPFWFLEFLLATTDTNTEPEKLQNYNVGDQTGKRDELLNLIIKFYSLPESTRTIKPPYLHILDIYRRGLISQDSRGSVERLRYLERASVDLQHIRRFLSRSHMEKARIMHERQQLVRHCPSASKLYEAGIPFKKSPTASLKDIGFHHGTLRFPQFLITKDSASTLANLMAFERLHPGTGSEVTSYVFFLNGLIHNARDVSLLESHGILQHTLRDDEDVLYSLSLISNHVVDPPDDMLHDLYIVSQQLTNHRFKKRLNMWRLDLLEKYFNTPWGALSVIAAVLLLILTIIQTVYTVLGYIHRNK